MKYTFMENFKEKDPEFYDFYSHFIGEEVINDTTLDDKSRYLSITAVLLSDSNVIMSQCIQVDNVPIGTLSTCRVKL